MFIYGRSGMTVSGRTLTNKFAATLGLTICLLGIGVAPISAQSPFTWNNATGGVFNTVGNWNPNAPSPGFLSGVDETLNLGSFLNAVTPGYSATAAAGFTRVINFNNTYGSPAITITTGVLSFNSAAGLPAQLNQNGFGLANIGGFTMASPLTVGGTGAGNLFVTGGITNNAGATGSLLSLNQTGGGFSNTGATVVLSTAGTWQAAATASTVINGANVAVGSGSSLGASSLNSITFNSGSFRFNSTALTMANNFTLNNTMTVLHSTGTSGTNTISGVIGGNGGLNINPLTGLTLALTGTNTFSGDVVYRGTNNSTGFGLTLSGAAGSMANVNNITITSNSSLTLDNTTTLTSGTRLNANAIVNLNSARLTHQGNSTVATTTSFATLNSMGQALITVNPGAASLTGGGSTLAIGTWNRSLNSTALIQARDLGLAPAANVSTITLTNNPGGAIGGLLPYAVANTSSSTTTPVNTFVRYDAVSQRLVGLSHTTDYQGGLPATQVMELYRNTNAAANYRATTNQAGLTNTTVNSLILDSTASTAPFIGASIAGAGTLNVTSGAILSSATSTTASTIRNTIGVGTLNFGANTGYLHTAGALGTTAIDLNITSTIAGSGGLVKAGQGTVILTGNNTFTGDLTINAGNVSITSDANLGAAGNVVNLNSGNLNGLVFNPSNLFSHGSQTTLTTARNFTVGDSGGSIFVNNFNNTMTVNGNITGTGGNSGFFFKGGSGTLVLNGTNNYAGGTLLFDGVLAARNDAALGAASSDLIFVQGGVGALQAGSSFSTNRNVLAQSTAQFFTNGNNLTLNGVIGTQNITAGVGMTKLGTGDLILTNTNTYTGATTIGGTGSVIRSELSSAQTGGRLVLNGANGSIAMSSGLTINAGSTLRLDNSGTVNNFRVGRVATGMAGGEFEVLGNSTNNSSTAIGALTSSAFANTITLDQSSGTGSTTNALTVTSYVAPTNSQTTFIRGTNLGALSGNRTAALFNTAPTAHGSTIIASMVGSNSSSGSPTEFLKLGTAVGGQTPVEIFTAYSNDLPNAGATAVADMVNSVNLGAASTIGAARLSTNGNVDLSGFGWTIHSGSLISAGATNSITNSGALASMTLGGTTAQTGGTTAGFGRITNNGTLTIGSGVQIAATNVNKFGAGDLILNQAAASTATTWNVSQGTLRYGTAVAVALPIASTVNVNSGATLDLNNNAGVALANITGFGNFNVGTNGLTLSGQTGTLAGNVSGSGAMNLNGTGTLVVSGNSSGFNGGWNINGGNLQIQSTNGPGSGQIRIGDLAGTNSATLSVSSVAPTSITNNILVPIGSSGTRTLTHAVNTSGTFSGTINVANTATVGLQLNGPFSSTAIQPGAWTLAGDISGVGNVQWFGGNWNFWGNNSSWSGNFSADNFAAMQFGVGTDTAMGSGTLTWTTLGGMIRADNGARTLANNIVVNASTNAFSVTGTNDLNLNGTVLLNTAGGIHNLNVVNTGTTTLGGVISGASATSSMSQTGFGTLVLSGANTFGGGYTLNSGVLGLGNNSAVGTGTMTVNDGGILRATGGARNIANAVTVGGNFGVDGSNALTMAGTMNLGAAARTVVVRNAADTTFSGVISGTGTGTILTKEGIGKLIISGANNYTGNTVVAAGTLLVNNTTGSGTSAGSVTVNTGATLGGTGFLSGAVTVAGILAPGASIESMVSGAVTMNTGSTFAWETLDNSLTGADLMKVNGQLTLTNANLDLSLANLSAGTWLFGDKLTLFSYTGSAITSGFVGFTNLGAYTFGGNIWTFRYDDVVAGSNYNPEASGGSNFVTFTVSAIPEPTSFLMFGIACLVLSKRRRM